MLFVLPEIIALSQGEVGLLASTTLVHFPEKVIKCCCGAAHFYLQLSIKKIFRTNL